MQQQQEQQAQASQALLLLLLLLTVGPSRQHQAMACLLSKEPLLERSRSLRECQQPVKVQLQPLLQVATAGRHRRRRSSSSRAVQSRCLVGLMPPALRRHRRPLDSGSGR